MVLLIDNYDSFTYNLYQFIGAYDPDILVVRNDEIDSKQVLALKPDKVVISPGPKAPKDAGNCLQIIKDVAGQIPILGICLGHQCIGEAFGGNVIHAKALFHGKSSTIHLQEDKLFDGIAGDLTVARYHSLVVEASSLPECLKVLSRTQEGEIMAMKHKDFEVYGLQFHPESVLTQNGMRIIENFISL